MCDTQKGKGVLAGERGTSLWTVLGAALKLTVCYSVIQGKCHTFERNAVWHLLGARANFFVVIRGVFANPKISSMTLNWQLTC